MSDRIVLDEKTESICYLCNKDKRLAKVISMIGSISYELHDESPYSFMVHEIIEQMLSVKAGAKIYARLEDLCGGTVTPQRIQCLSDEQIKSIGTSNAKAAYIRGLTDAVIEGKIDFEQFKKMDDDAVLKTLTGLKGIGIWTAKMYLIFVLNRQDILPYEDVAFLQGYGWLYKTDDYSPSAVKTKCKKWKPYSSIAARYMYRALDMGLTKNEFHLFK